MTHAPTSHGARPPVMDEPHAIAHEHPAERVYVGVAVILAVITAIEVAVYYFNLNHYILVPALLILSAAKFVAVVGYFMHLKFDDRRFTFIFASGLAVALAVFLGTAAMFIYHTHVIQ